MSSFFSLYRRGIVSMVTGPTVVAIGVVTGTRLLMLAGVVGLAWGVYRFYSFRSKTAR
jgi:hypothetical protein